MLADQKALNINKRKMFFSTLATYKSMIITLTIITHICADA